MQQIKTEYITEEALYMAYMPYILQGGLFVITTQTFSLGEQITLKVLLPDALDEVIVTTQVIWHSSPNIPPNSKGVGLAFIDDPERLKQQIDNLLLNQLPLKKSTLTM